MHSDETEYWFTYGGVVLAQETLEHPEQSEERVREELD